MTGTKNNLRIQIAMRKKTNKQVSKQPAMRRAATRQEYNIVWALL